MSTEKLARVFSQIERVYLCQRRTEDERAIKGLVDYVKRKLLIPSFHKADIPVLSPIHVGSQYEYSSLPGSDFDLQFPVSMKGLKSTPILEKSDHMEVRRWMRIQGGPEHLLTSDGYLSNTLISDKFRRSLTQAISEFNRYNDQLLNRYNDNRIREKFRKALTQAIPEVNQYHDDTLHIEMEDGYGPAAILKVYWRQEKIDIDVVITVREEDCLNSQWRIVQDCQKNRTGVELQAAVAKRVTITDSANPDSLWKMSTCDQQREMMISFNKSAAGRQKLKLIKIMKVILKENKVLLKPLTTNMLKTIIFRLSDQCPNSDQWALPNASAWENRKLLAHRFKDMIQLIHHHMSDGCLTDYFDDHTDMLFWHAKNRPGELADLASCTSIILTSDNYSPLLQIPGISHYHICNTLWWRVIGMLIAATVAVVVFYYFELGAREVPN